MKIGKYKIYFVHVQDKYDKHRQPADDGDPEIYFTTIRYLLGKMLLREVRNWWLTFHIWPKPFKK